MASESTAEHPLVLIVLLNWNDTEQTLAAVEAVSSLHYPNFQTLVVDNGSEERSLKARIESLALDAIEVHESPINLGYAGGCNLGFKKALELEAEFVWLLNNDATCPAGTLSSLVACARQDPRIGLVSPLIASDREGKMLSYAGGVTSLPQRFHDTTNDLEQARKWREEYPNSAFISGAAMLVRTQLVRDIGMLDESLFAYYEDTDYSVRSLAAAYRNVVDQGSFVYHPDHPIELDPCGVKPHYWYYMGRNAFRFWRKHLGPIGSLRPSWWTIRWALRQADKVKSNPAGQQALYDGVWHGIWHRSGPYKPNHNAPNLIAGLMSWYGRRL